MSKPQTIAAGVESFAARTPTLPPATHTQSYALGEREVILVEPATPFEDERREWLGWARELESTGRRPIALFLTHHHADHAGGAEFFARELGLPLWAHALTAERLSNVRVDRRLEDGEALTLQGPTPQAWEVLHTPGHAPGHLCLFERRLSMLLVGDMVASEGTILVAPGDGDMRQYLAQLERLEGLGAKVALPAHGGPIHDPGQLFSYYVAHRKMREDKVLGAVRRTPGSAAEELLPLVYDDTPKAAWPWALMSLRAHLDKLISEGVVEDQGERFSAAS